MFVFRELGLSVRQRHLRAVIAWLVFLLRLARHHLWMTQRPSARGEFMAQRLLHPKPGQSSSGM